MIPKIEWKNKLLSIDLTNLSDVVICNTVGIDIGEEFVSTQLARCEVVEIINTTTMKIDKVATADLTEIVEIKHVHEFDYPPQKDDPEKIKAKKHERKSLSGVRQISIDYIELQFKPMFDFLTLEQVEHLKLFYQDHATRGKSFFYFPDKSINNSLEYEASVLDFTPKRTTPVLYNLKFSWRRLHEL